MVQMEGSTWLSQLKGNDTLHHAPRPKLTSVLVLGWLWLGLALWTWEAGFISFCSCMIFSVSSFRVFMMLALSSGFIPRFFSRRFIKAWKKKDEPWEGVKDRKGEVGGGRRVEERWEKSKVWTAWQKKKKRGKERMEDCRDKWMVRGDEASLTFWHSICVFNISCFFFLMSCWSLNAS